MAIADVTDHSIADLVSLKGRNAIVTGGATGLGKAMVRRLAQAGANVVIADIDLDLAQETAALFQPQVEGRILTFSVDAANSASVRAAIDFTLEQFGGIDILVNNAALYPSIPVLDTDDEEWDKVMAVNLRGLFVGSREVSREMINAGKGGIIINVSSQAGFRGVSPGLAAYVASKHGVRGLTRQMAIELAPHGIRVLGIAPSHARTEKTAEAITAMPELLDQIPALSTSLLGRVGVPDDMARVVLFLASDMSLFMTGSTLKIDAGEMA